MEKQDCYAYTAFYDLHMGRAKEIGLDALDVCTHFLHYWPPLKKDAIKLTSLTYQASAIGEPELLSVTFLGPMLRDEELMVMCAINGVVPGFQRSVT